MFRQNFMQVLCINGCSGVFAWQSPPHTYYNSQGKGKGIEQILDNGYRADRCKSCRYQYLSAIGQQPLGNARGRIQDTCALTLVHTEFVCYVVGNRSCRHDCNRIVCSADVHKADEQGYAHFRTAFSRDAPRYRLDDILHPAVMTDYGEHTTSKQSHNQQLGHTGHSVSQSVEPPEHIIVAQGYPDDSAQTQSYNQYQQHVHAHDPTLSRPYRV